MPAVEVLISTAYIRECIVNPEKTRIIKDAIAAGTSQYGMQTFDQSLYDLYMQGLITFEEAMETPPTPTTSSCACRASPPPPTPLATRCRRAGYGR